MNFLPGRRVVLLFIAILVVAISIFLIINREGGEEIFEKDVVYQDKGIAVLLKVDPELDTDGDGLKDWQEALWQTDKNNTDTDGDGTSDGQEVGEGRNPTNGSIEDTLQLENYEYTGSFTQQVSQNLFSQYNILKQEGVVITEDTQEALVQGSLGSNDFSLDINVFTFNDISVRYNRRSKSKSH